VRTFKPNPNYPPECNLKIRVSSINENTPTSTIPVNQFNPNQKSFASNLPNQEGGKSSPQPTVVISSLDQTKMSQVPSVNPISPIVTTTESDVSINQEGDIDSDDKIIHMPTSSIAAPNVNPISIDSPKVQTKSNSDAELPTVVVENISGTSRPKREAAKKS
jgi:hypothetical protein